MMTASQEELKLTRNQRLVMDVLQREAAPVTAYKVLDELRDYGFRAPLQVYRALDKLQTLGVVHRIESMNAFVACRGHHEEAGETVAFAICEDCGEVREIADPDVGARLADLCTITGFTPRKTTLEIRGRCARCAVKGETGHA